MPILARPNVLIVLLEYINFFQFEWQHETDFWERLPCTLPLHFAAFHV